MDDLLGTPVRAECACGTTWVFPWWPMRPCGRCGQRVTVDLTGDDDGGR